VEQRTIEQIEPANRRREWLLPVVLVSGLLICCVLGFVQFEKWVERRRPAAEVFYEKAMAKLQRGTSIKEVAQLFGESKVLTRDDVPGWVVSLIVDPRANIYNPDGIESEDKFLHYSVTAASGNNEEWYFQFRNGKLVNHEPTLYPATYAKSQETIVGLSR
jgi:hypothetical protein